MELSKKLLTEIIERLNPGRPCSEIIIKSQRDVGHGSEPRVEIYYGYYPLGFFRGDYICTAVLEKDKDTKDYRIAKLIMDNKKMSGT